MKMLAILLALMLFAIPADASQKHKKQYMREDNIFLFEHGMYTAYPNNLYKIGRLYYSREKGFYTYKCHLKRIPLERLNHAPWSGAVKIR